MRECCEHSWLRQIKLIFQPQWSGYLHQRYRMMYSGTSDFIKQTKIYKQYKFNIILNHIANIFISKIYFFYKVQLKFYQGLIKRLLYYLFLLFFDIIQKFSYIRVQNNQAGKIMNQNNNKNCYLHNSPFQYFCQKCYEPICKKCTILGPHNTQGHSISTLATAYQRRLMEVKDRITVFIDKKRFLIEQVRNLSVQIQILKEKKGHSINENEKYKNELSLQLQKSYDRIVNEIILLKQQFQTKLNEINDLGHTFQHMDNPIEIIASHSHILQSLKECADRLSLLLTKEKQHEEMPKVLSDIRLDLKYIQVYKTLIDQKVLIIQNIFERMDKEIEKIQRPVIDYQSLLKQLSLNIQRCIEHNICHYCGAYFSIEKANTLCSKNTSALQINQFIGFCQKKPDSSKWATKHHYFAPPLQKFSHFKTTQPSTFTTHLNSLFLKLKTILIIRHIDLLKVFTESDKHKSQSCDRISMLYILKQVCGLNDTQSEIFLTICQKEKGLYNYNQLILRLDAIPIDNFKSQEQKMSLPMKSLIGETIQSKFIK